MGFRDGLRKAGGFWNNVDGVIEDYEFTTVPPNGKEEGEWAYLVPSVKIDGAKEATTQHLFLGGGPDAGEYATFEISKDGKELTMIDGSNVSIGENTAGGKFLASLLDAGFPEDLLPDLAAGEPLRLDNVIGTRIRLSQQKNEEATAKLGKRKSKTGKGEFDRTDTIVAKVYETPKRNTNGSGKLAAKTSAKSTGKKVETEVAVDELAGEVLRDILEANGGKLPKAKLSMKVINHMLKLPTAQKALREEVRKFLFEDENLAAIEGVDYDASDKNQMVSLA